MVLLTTSSGAHGVFLLFYHFIFYRCVHYLKLPEYSSEDALLEKLLLAVETKGFHLN